MFDSMRSDLTRQLQEIRDAGLWKPERVIGSPQGANVAVLDRKVLNLCANNYLGLADDPRGTVAVLYLRQPAGRLGGQDSAPGSGSPR